MKQDEARDNSAGFLIQEVARLLRRRFEVEANTHGLTLPQWRALAEIARTPGVAQVQLAAAIDTDQMTVSGIVTRLEKRGLIERYPDPNDSRAKLARLTRQGTELVDEARHVGRAVYADALEGLGDAEREALTAGLRAVRGNLERIAARQKQAS